MRPGFPTASRPTKVVTLLTFVVLQLTLAACQQPVESTAAPAAAASPASAAPHLPDNDAGRVVARAIAAAGGWDTWLRHRDAAFISTLTLFDPLGNATSETIFMHKLPLHEGLKTRLESIGLSEELVLGFDGRDAWMLRDGLPINEPNRIAFTRFNAISAAYWFNLPFVLAELPGQLSYAGTVTEGDKRVEKVRVTYQDIDAAPADWLVIYFDAGSGLIDHVHSHITAAFLRQSLWVGKWYEYRDIDGIKRERRHMFFPADTDGAAIGPMAAEQLVEHVRFDNGFSKQLFVKPAEEHRVAANKHQTTDDRRGGRIEGSGLLSDRRVSVLSPQGRTS